MTDTPIKLSLVDYPHHLSQTQSWEKNMAGGLTFDRSGNIWKVYPNGRMLCANTRPFHYPYCSQNRDTNGPCDCTNRTGKVVATIHHR